jgi:nucleoside-diphosphate-sugar epimerase
MTTNDSALSVLVTGATTSVGREVTRQFVARGHRVTGQTDAGSSGGVQIRQDGGLPAFSSVFRAGEIKSMATVGQSSVVVHTIPQLLNTFPTRDLVWDKRLLDEATTALIEAAQSANIQFLVFLSSALVYADTHNNSAAEAAPRRSGALARAILAAEERVLSSGIPACILRAGTVYGAEDRTLASLADSIRSGRGVYLGDSHSEHSWVHAADLASAAVLAAEQKPAGQVFNIADDQPASPTDFAKHLAASLGLAGPSGSIPAFMLNRMTSAVQREIVDSAIRLNSDKAKQTLGWKPKYAHHTAGLEQVLLSWRAETPVRTR